MKTKYASYSELIKRSTLIYAICSIIYLHNIIINKAIKISLPCTNVSGYFIILWSNDFFLLKKKITIGAASAAKIVAYCHMYHDRHFFFFSFFFCRESTLN